MGMVEDFQVYIDSVGLLQNTPNPGTTCASGNGLLYTGLGVALLSKLGDRTLFPTFTQALSTCEKWQGMYVRHPLDSDQEAGDDYYGIGVASKLIGTAHAARILERGRTLPFRALGVPFSYYYANTDQDSGFNLQAWLGRFPALVAHWQYCAGETPALSSEVFHAGAIAFSSWPNEDAPTISWLMLQVAPRTPLHLLARDHFYARLYAKYPNGMKDVFTKTFGPDHPLSKYSDSNS